MSSHATKWINEGTGSAPALRWSFVTDSPIQTMGLANEPGTLLVADQSGGMYLFDRRGKILAVSRGFLDVRDLSFCERGSGAVAVLGENRIVAVTPALKIDWSIELSEPVLTAAIAPFGEHFAACLSNGVNYIMRSDRKRIAKFETLRPIRFARFSHTRTELVLAAEYGFLGVCNFRGEPLWKEKLFSNVGEMAMASDAGLIALALFAHGIQKYTREGDTAGRYMVEGTPHQIALSESGNRIAMTTLERHVYWIDLEGNLIWAATSPDVVRKICVSPLGDAMFLGLKNGRILALEWATP
ncbi:MAG TPA: hypothetical protein VMM56_16780 [Planctomycetaceae bacterium]|nr:hypothetical protein [Planctomycetaceae bacterium]